MDRSINQAIAVGPLRYRESLLEGQTITMAAYGTHELVTTEPKLRLRVATHSFSSEIIDKILTSKAKFGWTNVIFQ